MNLTKLLTVSTKKTLIFSKMVDQIHKKKLEIEVKNRIPIKTSRYFIDLQQIFQRHLVICNDSK